MSRANISRLRIIGGQWKRRYLPFLAIDGLRPTPDRVRETLFNWLQFDIRGWHCLDAFAGSGALGVEALSRGAASCLFLERHPAQARFLQEQLQTLEAVEARVRCADSLQLLASLEATPFDLVFLDPPYALNLWAPACALLLQHKLLHADSLVYMEADKPWSALGLPAHWICLKETRAGSVYGFLTQATTDTPALS